MLAIKGIYDGKKIEPIEEVPLRERRNVIIFPEEFLEEAKWKKK